MVNTKMKNSIIALVTLLAALLLSFLFFYPSESNLGKGFTLSVFFVIGRNVFIGLGLLAFVLRIFRIVPNSSYWYIMPAIFNLFIGVFALFLYSTNQMEMSYFNKCLINLLIGFILLSDSYFLHFISRKP